MRGEVHKILFDMPHHKQFYSFAGYLRPPRNTTYHSALLASRFFAIVPFLMEL